MEPARKPAPASAGNPMLPMFVIVVAVGVLGSVAIMLKGPGEPADCSRQRRPVKELYPRLSCAEARAELDRVAQGRASPRTIVLRPLRLSIDARDVVGPAKLTCDGLEFALQDAGQADPTGPIVFTPGPHSVLANVLPDGRLHRPQWVICGDVVAGERRGEYPQ